MNSHVGQHPRKITLHRDLTGIDSILARYDGGQLLCLFLLTSDFSFRLTGLILGEAAAATLRVTLSRLRKSLQPAGQYLISEAGNVGFNFEQPFELDLDWLAMAVLVQTASGDLKPILDFDRGEFLAGFSLPDAPDFDNWVTLQREMCQRQVETVYDRLTQHQLANHDGAAAVSTAARWLARAPLTELAYRRLMAAEALAGDRPAALKTYNQCQTMLQQEFGMAPAQETTDLAAQITRPLSRFAVADAWRWQLCAVTALCRRCHIRQCAGGASTRYFCPRRYAMG